MIIPQLQQMAPETADLASVFQHQFLIANIHNQDDCDTSQLHSQVCQPADHNTIQNYKPSLHITLLQLVTKCSINLDD